MKSRVEITHVRDGVIIDIKQAESRWFGVFSFVFAVWVAWSSRKEPSAWVSAPFFLFSVVLNLRIYGCAQRIAVSKDHIDLSTMIGPIRVGHTRISTGAVDRTELRERLVRMKGHRYLSRRIVFMSTDGELARKTHLSVGDAGVLLSGPLNALGPG